MAFQNDYHHILDVLANKRPKRLPIYEHIISPAIMEKILDVQFAELGNGSRTDRIEFFSQYCRFFQEMSYDTVSFEVCIVEILPDNGALSGENPAQSRTERILNATPGMSYPNVSGRLLSPGFRLWHNVCPRE